MSYDGGSRDREPMGISLSSSMQDVDHSELIGFKA